MMLLFILAMLALSRTSGALEIGPVDVNMKLDFFAHRAAEIAKNLTSSPVNVTFGSVGVDPITFGPIRVAPVEFGQIRVAPVKFSPITADIAIPIAQIGFVGAMLLVVLFSSRWVISAVSRLFRRDPPKRELLLQESSPAPSSPGCLASTAEVFLSSAICAVAVGLIAASPHLI